jgi:hypothetical protein
MRMMENEWIGVLTWLACGSIALGAGACRRSDAATLARDRATLDAIIAEDATVDRALMDADGASRAGEDDRAAALLETSAAPAADRAIADADAAKMETPWGTARRDDLRRLLSDRRAEIPRYAAALRGTDLDAMLAAIEAQVGLQKRAVEAAASVAAGAPPSAQ